MSKTEQDYRQEIVEIGKVMYQKGWVAANDGNITVRLDDRRVLCTPTGVSKGMMKPEDMSVCDMEGAMLEGSRGRTSEILMHLTIYRMRPDVQSVVHAHPPVATGFAVAGRPLNLALVPEVVINLGCIPLAQYGLPGTPELTRDMLAYIPRYDALLMGNHGVVAYGSDLRKAFFNMETVEHTSQVNLVAELLGGPRVLPRREVQKLFDSRGRYGVPSRADLEPGSPVVAEDYRPAGERLTITKEELTALIEEVLRARGMMQNAC
jgi:L-fuculose-phosphate aldolase